MVYLMTECDTVDGAASVEHVDALRSLLRTLSSVFALLLLSITASPAQVRRGAPCSCCLWGWLAQWWANGGRGRGAHTHYERVKQPVREETCSVSRMLSAAARWCAVTLHEASAPLGVLIGSVRSHQLQPPPQPRHPLLPQGFSLHILPVDYHHCQSWLLHSSCCPHSGSGANLSRLQGGRKLSHTALRSQAAAHQNHSSLPSVQTTINNSCLLFRQAFPGGTFKQYPELQMFRTSPLYLEIVHQCKTDSGGFPANHHVLLSAGVSSEQSQGRVLPSLSKRLTFSSHLQCETQPLSS